MNPDPFTTGPKGAGSRARRVALTTCACALALAVAACSHAPDDTATAASTTPTNVHLTAEQQQHIGIRTVATAQIHTTVEATGAVDFDNDHAVSVIAPFSGPVVRVLVQPGQKVRKGDALAIVDSSDFSAAIDTYAKSVVTAKNLRKIADTDRDLAQHKGVSERENEQAQTDAAGADADREAALQALVSLGMNPATIAEVQSGKRSARAQGVIRAPISGTVTDRSISPGTLLQAGSTTCFTIADLSQVWVMAQLSPSDLKSVAIGDPVDVLGDTVANDLKGTVTNISAVVDPDTRAVIARVSVDNPGGTLKKQMYVRVQIHSQTPRQGLETPASAILRDDENLPFVYAVATDGSFERRPVTLGTRDGNVYEITAGLHAGDRIVVDGGLFMQFMQSQ